MAQLTSAHLLAQEGRLGIRHAAGPLEGAPITTVEIGELDTLEKATAGTLIVIASTAQPAPYRLDIAIRQASARRLSGIIMLGEVQLAGTAAALAERAGVPILLAPGARPSELVVAIDRMLSGDASETITRATYAIERATHAAETSRTADAIIAAAASALGADITLVADASVSWTDNDAVFVGEVPVGRLVCSSSDPAVTVALPVIASIVSRTSHREMRDRFAPTLSRADLIIELVLAESSRVEGFVGQGARLGLPLQLAHVVGWLKVSHRSDPERRPSHTVQPAVELFALQLFADKSEQLHIAFLHDDALIVSTEEPGSGAQQRRLREVAEAIKEHASSLAGEEWHYTLGLGTPQAGAAGLRQSAAEARVAAETAIASGRAGSIEVTDVTGLRRVLLDFYASPTSRNLLDDILHPLDALGPEKAAIAVQTLQSYLSHRNSLAHAGAELNLHPNAVGYRLRRVRELLQVDLDDPDTRFSVELACRVRMLRAGRA